MSAALREVARRRRLTLNTLVQGAWSLLLAQESGRDDVAFGVTVAGRPADLPGVSARRLEIEWGYSAGRHESASIRRLAAEVGRDLWSLVLEPEPWSRRRETCRRDQFLPI